MFEAPGGVNDGDEGDHKTKVEGIQVEEVSVVDISSAAQCLMVPSS
jgi:hypothetical protein